MRCSWLALFALAQSGCTIDDIDHSGKRCTASSPCADGWTCLAGYCEKIAGELLDDCVPTAAASDFRADWSTPNQIRWTWTPRGEPIEFEEYWLLTAASAQDLEAATGSVRNHQSSSGVVTSATDYELGHWTLVSDAGQDELVDAVRTIGLGPQEQQFARIITLGTDCRVASNSASAKTSSPFANELALLDADLISGKPYPIAAGGTNATISTKGAYGSSAADPNGLYFAVPVGEPSSGPDRFEVGLGDMRLPPGTLGALQGHFETAHLDLWVRYFMAEGTPHWSTLIVELGDPQCFNNATQKWTAPHLGVRYGGGFQQLQVPLHALSWQGRKLDEATLLSNTLCGVKLASRFLDGQQISMDEVFIRW